MVYLQTSKTYMIDTETYKFVAGNKRDQHCDVDVPFFLWGYGSGNVAHKQLEDGSISYLRKVFTLNLNNLRVAFSGISTGAIITFYDSVRKGTTVIKLDYFLRTARKWAFGSSAKEILGVDYTIKIGDQPKREFQTKLVSSEDSAHYTKIADLDNNEIASSNMDDKLCYGIRKRPYDIIYRAKKLNGQSLALVCGTWAILLTDKLEFDSLVTLDCARTPALGVDNIVYSVNTYVVKAKTLLG